MTVPDTGLWGFYLSSPSPLLPSFSGSQISLVLSPQINRRLSYLPYSFNLWIGFVLIGDIIGSLWSLFLLFFALLLLLQWIQYSLSIRYLPYLGSSSTLRFFLLLIWFPRCPSSIVLLLLFLLFWFIFRVISWWWWCRLLKRTKIATVLPSHSSHFGVSGKDGSLDDGLGIVSVGCCCIGCSWRGCGRRGRRLRGERSKIKRRRGGYLLFRTRDW